jgi:hypothetical protein
MQSLKKIAPMAFAGARNASTQRKVRRAPAPQACGSLSGRFVINVVAAPRRSSRQAAGCVLAPTRCRRPHPQKRDPISPIRVIAAHTPASYSAAMPAHDNAYKNIFSHPQVVADLLTGFVAQEWVHAVDLTTLDKCNGSYVSDDLRDRQDDLVWRVRRGDEVAYVYLLLEFQSSADVLILSAAN